MTFRKLELSLKTDDGEILEGNCMSFVLYKTGVINKDQYTWIPVEMLSHFFRQSTKRESDIILMTADNKIVHLATWYDKKKDLVRERAGYNSPVRIKTLKGSMRGYSVKHGEIKNMYLKRK